MAQVTAAPWPIKFGDVEYKMSPLSDKDIDEVNNWLRASYIQMARDSLTPDMSQKDREETLSVAMKTARKISFIEGEGASLIGSLEGLLRVLYQGIKRNHKTLKYDEFQSQVFELKKTDPDALASDVEAASSVFLEVNIGKQTGEDSKKDPPEPAT